MSKRRQHAPEIKAKIVLATLKGEETTAELVRGTSVTGNASKACVREATMIHQWKQLLLEAASGVIEPCPAPPHARCENRSVALTANISRLTRPAGSARCHRSRGLRQG